MAGTDDTPEGKTGTVTVAIPGPGRAGEVQVAIRGGTESFIAYADGAVSRGTAVLVVGYRGGRTVDVISS